MKYSATILKRFLDIYEKCLVFLFLLLVENKSLEQFMIWQVKCLVHNLFCCFGEEKHFTPLIYKTLLFLTFLMLLVEYQFQIV